MPRRALATLALLLALPPPVAAAAETPLTAASADILLRDALAAEAKHDTRHALERFLAAEKAGRSDAFVLQKIARQYSDLTLDLRSRDEQRAAAQHAVDYSLRAVALEPRNPLNVLSVAISYGRLALASDTRDKVRYSRLVREEAERSLSLDPNYAWAHHVLARWHLEVAALGAPARAFVKLFYGGLPAASVGEAIRHLERAVALEPDELQHHLELGHAYLAAADPARARPAFARGLALPSRAKDDEPAKSRARTALSRLESKKP